jgi:hypothetical protein
MGLAYMYFVHGFTTILKHVKFTFMLRRIFGPKRDEVTREWRKLHSGELQNFYSSPDIIRQLK